MPVKNESPTRFRDEISIISPWAYSIACIGFAAVAVLLGVVPQWDKNPPPLAVMASVGIFAGAVTAGYILLIGYVNGDSGRRGMSRALWTLIAIFIPNGFGIILYFILRKPRTLNCPQCNALVEPGFGFCPRCRHRLTAVCPQCQRGVNGGGKFCPYCGAEIGTETNDAVAGGHAANART